LVIDDIFTSIMGNYYGPAGKKSRGTNGAVRYCHYLLEYSLDNLICTISYSELKLCVALHFGFILLV